MKITAFYTDILGANLKNQRWSWGSYDPITNRIYLRVWDDEIQKFGNSDYIRILRSEPRRFSTGYAERREQIEMIRNGAEGFGVLCIAADPETEGARKIKSFDQSQLLTFGSIVKRNGHLFAEIAGKVHVSELVRNQTSAATLPGDLKALIRKKIETTKREALINARVGQGRFRSDVLRMWGQRCAVTNASAPDVIRASHIKPWRFSNDEEKLDPENGLPLVANLDALFDAGLISFDRGGELLLSQKLDATNRQILGLEEGRLARKPEGRMTEYLRFHESEIFQRE